MTPSFRLRLVVETDERRMLDVFAASRETEVAALPPEVAEVFVESQYRLQRQQYLGHHPGAEWSVIEVDDTVAGRVVIDRSCRPFVVIDIVVVPEMRRRGVATAILTDLLDEARQSGTGVRLTVATHNRPAIRLYERLGLQVDDVEGAYISMSSTSGEG